MARREPSRTVPVTHDFPSDLGRVIEALPFAVYVCDAPGGAIRAFNQPMVELWGREPEKGDSYARGWEGSRFAGLDGEPLALSGTPMAEALGGVGSRTGEMLLEGPDGSRLTVRATASPLHDADGRLVGTVNAFLDVTEQSRAEEATARLAAIVAGADDAIISKTLDGIITSWNGAAEGMFGYPAAEAVGRSITLIIPPDRLGEEAEILRRLRRGETIDHFETERVARDGRRIAASLSISPIRDTRGRIIGASKILRDTTERRRVEESLKSTVQTLEILYRLADLIGRARGQKDVCDAGVQAILSMARADRASVLVFDDAGVMRFVCWSGLSDGYRAATEGHSPWSANTPDPRPILIEDARDDSPSLGALRETVLSEGIRSLGFFPLVFQGRLLGKFMLYYDAPHAFSPEELRLASIAAQHISLGLSRAASEEAVDRFLHLEQAARREAEVARGVAVRANRDKDEFLAMLAHELRNPVGIIVNAVSIVEGTPGQGASASRATAMIRRQAAHLSRLLDDLLDVARITSGRIQIDAEAVDLGELVDVAVESQRHRLESKRQRLVLAPRPPGVFVLGDPVRLQQVLGNLVNNASKYSDAGGTVRVSLEVEGAEAVLRVSDDGAGIPEDKLDSIFELFAQADPGLARTEGGLGIGLTLVRRIVELHGGTVLASSEGLGRGAELTVRLPIASEAAPSTPAAPPPKPTRRRIVVIEDHPDGREALATSLSLQGHEVRAAATGREGIEVAASSDPDAVLIDIGLPDVDGYEVARTLRARLAARVPLVALTGYGQPQDRARAKAAGFDAHLVKPVEPARLVQVLESLTQAR